MAIQDFIQTIIRSLLILLILFSGGYASAGDKEINYRSVFGIDVESMLTTIETMTVTVIVLGVTKGEAAVDVNMLMDIMSFEKAPILNYIKPYLKPNIFSDLSAHADKSLFPEQIPEGMSIFLNDDLEMVIELTPTVMKDIDPALVNTKPKTRGALSHDIFSTVNDVSVGLINKSGISSHSAIIDSALRLNRFLVSGSMQYRDDQATFFDDNWVTNFEGKDKSYYWGNINNPTFANLSAKSISAGVAIGNTDLRRNIIFESDPRYISLIYPANIKIYIDDILHQEVSLTAGQHRLNIPSQNNLFKVRVDITDVYGRFKAYNFFSSGKISEPIPIRGSYLYYLSHGENEDQKKQLYAGVKLGLNAQSKAAVAFNYKTDDLVLAMQHYQIIPIGSVRNTLTTSYVGTAFGYKINTDAQLRINQDVSVNLRYQYSENLRLNTLLLNNSHLLSLSSGYQLFEGFSVFGSVEYHLGTKNNDHMVSASYRFDRNLLFRASYSNKFDSKSIGSISLNWTSSNNKAGFYSSYNSENNNINHKASYTINPNQSLGVGIEAASEVIDYTHRGSVFNSTAKIKNYANNQSEYNITTGFSLVSANTSVAVMKKLGSHSGFAIIKADKYFEGSVEITHQGSKCQLSASKQCAVSLRPEYEVEIDYDLKEVDIGVSVEPPQLSFITAARGGIQQIIKTQNSYFVEGRIIDGGTGQTIRLVIGNIIDENNNKVVTFTDDTGVFFTELREGSYRYKASGFEPAQFYISKQQVKENIVNVGNITLTHIAVTEK